MVSPLKGFKPQLALQLTKQLNLLPLEHGTLFYRLAVQWSLVWFAAWLNKQKSAKYIIETGQFGVRKIDHFCHEVNESDFFKYKNVVLH